MKRLVVLACAAAAIAACGVDDEPAAGPPARPVSALGCSPVTYGGPGRPRFLIVISSGFQGIYGGHGVQTAQAVKMVLAGRGWRAGDYTIGLQACEETDAATDLPSPEKCARNARAFAREPSVLGVIGPLTSNCATHMLATLNAAPDGPLATISGGNTYVGLTRAGPGTLPGEPERYTPTGRRGYARLAPTDDVQGAANALHARKLGLTRAYVVEEASAYGRGLAASFRYAAARVGLHVLGSAHWDGRARDYHALAARIRRGHPEAVFVAGDVAANGPKLIADLSAGLGDRVQLMAGDAFNLPTKLVEAAGAGAEGLRISIAVLPNRRLPPAGRRFSAEFEQRFSQRPCCFSVHDAQGTRMLLDAIAASGGHRDRVTENLMHSRVEDGLVGDFEIDATGDTTLSTMGIYRIEHGSLRFETAISPARELLGR